MPSKWIVHVPAQLLGVVQRYSLPDDGSSINRLTVDWAFRLGKETISIWHSNLGQRFVIHNVLFLDKTIQIEDICCHGISFVSCESARRRVWHGSMNVIPDRSTIGPIASYREYWFGGSEAPNEEPEMRADIVRLSRARSTQGKFSGLEGAPQPTTIS